jgi:hypothetical protein
VRLWLLQQGQRSNSTYESCKVDGQGLNQQSSASFFT